MNSHWKTIISLICILLILSISCLLLLVKNADLKTQIKDQEALEMQIKDMEVKAQTPKTTEIIEEEQIKEELSETKPIIDNTELLEFLASYVSAQRTYIKNLQNVCNDNNIIYPIFIYAEINKQLE